MSKRPNRSTIELPAPMWERLRAEADRTGLKVSEIIRRAIDAHLPERSLMTAHNPIGYQQFEIGDVVQILHITSERGRGSYEISSKARRRTTGYNNVITSPDGLGRIIAGSEPNWTVERDDTLTAANLEATQQALADRAERIRQAVEARERILSAERRPEILQTVNGPIPYLTGRGRITQEEHDTLSARWDADAALMEEALGVTVRDLIDDGRLPN